MKTTLVLACAWQLLTSSVAPGAAGENLNPTPQSAVDFFERGVTRQTKGDLDGAIADYNRAIALDSGLALAYANRGNARKAKGDRFGAMEDLDKALALQARPPPR
jgi:tetratricopeptide (TPR) repeat protein